MPRSRLGRASFGTTAQDAIILKATMTRGKVGMEGTSIDPCTGRLKTGRDVRTRAPPVAGRRLSTAAGAALLGSSGPAQAIGDKAKLRFARLHLPDLPNPRPTALRRLAWEIERRTSLVTVAEPVEIAAHRPRAVPPPVPGAVGRSRVRPAARRRGGPAAAVPHLRRLPADRFGRGAGQRPLRRVGAQAAGPGAARAICPPGSSDDHVRVEVVLRAAAGLPAGSWPRPTSRRSSATGGWR